MIKKVFTLYFFPVLVCLLAGCGDDDAGGLDGERVAVVFGSASIATTKTTADGNKWTQGDEIGIFMFETGETLSTQTIVENMNNTPYTAQKGDTESVGFLSSGSTHYFPADGSKVDFIAYYPYKSSLANFIYPVDVTDQTDPAKIDILYSNNARGKDKTSEKVDLQFSHVLSKVSFTLQPGTGSPDLTNATIAISNLYRRADLSLPHNTVDNPASKGTVTVNPTTRSAIVIPQKAINKGDYILTVTLADKQSVFKWDFPDNTEFKAGKNHIYTITVSKTGITVTTGDIMDWEEKDSSATEGGAGRYKVGDYYPDPDAVYNNGILVSGKPAIGIVYWLDPTDSRHGKIVSLDEATGLRWSFNGDKVTAATDWDNGRKNMKTILFNINNDQGIWAHYPAFEWAHNKNAPAEDYSDENATGIWYLPAINEGVQLSNAYRAYGTTEFNDKLTAAGGNAMYNSYHWSSTEYSNTYAYLWHTANGTTTGGSGKTGTDYWARCVRVF